MRGVAQTRALLYGPLGLLVCSAVRRVEDARDEVTFAALDLDIRRRVAGGSHLRARQATPLGTFMGVKLSLRRRERLLRVRFEHALGDDGERQGLASSVAGRDAERRAGSIHVALV